MKYINANTMNLNPCGHSCVRCPSYLGEDEQGRTCFGCVQSKGKPWWGNCNLFECVKSRNITHCGECPNFPCDLQIFHYDSDNPQGQRNAIIRTGLLAIWAKDGMEKAMRIGEKLRSLP
jgi:hypothetical protein